MKLFRPLSMLVIALIVHHLTFGQTTTLVEWTFPNSSADATADAATSTPDNTTQTILSGRTSSCGTALPAIDFTVTGVQASPDKCANSTGWDAGSGCKYWEVTVNTTGFTTLKVSSKQRSSNTGPKEFKLQYKVGSGTYADVTGGSVTVANNFTTGVLSDIDLPSGCNNQPAVYLRWIMTSNTSVSNGTVASGGTSRIDEIKITGQTASCTAPTTQSSDITFANTTTSSSDVNWTAGNGSNRLVYMNSSNSFTDPADGGSFPAANTTWANSGQQLIYNGSGSTVSVSSLAANTTYWFRVYDYNCSGSNSKFNTGTATDNPQSLLTPVPASTASVVQAVTGSEANTISSLTTGTISSNTDGVQLWQFKLYDGDGSANDADGLPTIYKTWTITAGTGNTVPDWSAVLDNVKLFVDGSITPLAAGVLVNSGNIAVSYIPGLSVADGAGSAKTISLRATVKNPMAAGSDGKRFVFVIDDADVTTDNNTVSSQLGTFSPVSDAGKNIIDVDATLQFVNAPATVPVGSNFSVTVSAVDANGNIDQNETPLITLSKTSGSGTLSGLSPHNLVAGTYTFTGLSYNTTGIFQITASAGGFSNVAVNITATNDPFLLFDDFNRANSNTVGIPSSGGSTAWTEDQTGDGSRLRIDGNELVLSNCNVSPQSGGSGNEQVWFNGTTKYATTFGNASDKLVWVFNFRQSRPDPSGFGSGNYGAALVLGSTEQDFTSATANGYAVVQGQSGSSDPIKLVSFTGGLGGTQTNIAVPGTDMDDNYASVRVEYNPCNNEWSIAVRNDASAFVSPLSSSPAYPAATTGTNSTYIATDLPYFGAMWHHNNSCSEIFEVDNLYIPNAASVPSATKVWKGLNANWNDANNWKPCPGVPTAADHVIIGVTGNNPVISAAPSGICNNLTVQSGASLTVNSSQFLNVHGNVENNGTASFGNGTLSLEGTGSATIKGTVTIGNVDIDKNVSFVTGAALNIRESLELQSGNFTATGGTLTLLSDATATAYLDNFSGGNSGSYTGNITVQRYVGNTADGYRDISSPVNGTVAQLNDDFSVFGQDAVQCWYAYTPYPNVQTYSEALSIVNGNYYEGWLSATGSGNSMSAMQGYAIRTYSGVPFTLDFTGSPYNGGYTRTITNTPSVTPAQDGWNFVGNPYPSSIDWVSAAALNSDITGSYYVFNTTDEYTGNWGVCNSVGACSGLTGMSATIASGQGFFVKTNAGGNFTLNNSVRVTNAASYYKTNTLENELRLSLSDSVNSDEVLCYTDVNATMANDNGLDAEKIAAGSTVYMGFEQQGNDYAINVLPELTEQTVLPLTIQVNQNGHYTFALNELNTNQLTPYLKDNTTNTETDLTQTSPILQLNANTVYTNYSVVFKQAVVSGINQPEQAVKIYADGNRVFVSRASNSPATISISNVLGQQLAETTCQSEQCSFALSQAGLWYAIVKVTEGEKVSVAKVFISNK